MRYHAQNPVIHLLTLLLANADKSDVEVFKTSECFCIYSVLTMMEVVNKTMKIGIVKISTSLYYLISFYGILGWSNYLQLFVIAVPGLITL